MSLSSMLSLSLTAERPWTDVDHDALWIFSTRYREIRKMMPLARQVQDSGDAELKQRMVKILKPMDRAIKASLENWRPERPN